MSRQSARRSRLRARPARLTWTPEFRLLMTGSYVSMFGSRITTFAFPLLALRLTNSPVAAGFVAFAATVPSVLFPTCRLALSSSTGIPGEPC